MLDSSCRLGCRMSLILRTLHAHLDLLHHNDGDVSDDHGERFHQDVEKRYQGYWDRSIMGDYIWNLLRENVTENRKKIRRNIHF